MKHAWGAVASLPLSMRFLNFWKLIKRLNWQSLSWALQAWPKVDSFNPGRHLIKNWLRLVSRERIKSKWRCKKNYHHFLNQPFINLHRLTRHHCRPSSIPCRICSRCLAPCQSRTCWLMTCLPSLLSLLSKSKVVIGLPMLKHWYLE